MLIIEIRWLLRPICIYLHTYISLSELSEFYGIYYFFNNFSQGKSSHGILWSRSSYISHCFKTITKISQSYQTTTQTFSGFYFATFIYLFVIWSFTQSLSWEIFSHNSSATGMHIIIFCKKKNSWNWDIQILQFHEKKYIRLLLQLLWMSSFILN